MLDAANAMLTKARAAEVRLALLTDTSAACGSEVIYRGARTEGHRQAGQGVCAALLIRHGIRVISQRDYRTLDLIVSKLDPTHRSNPDARDHHETVWYVGRTSGQRRAKASPINGDASPSDRHMWASWKTSFVPVCTLTVTYP